MVVRRSERKRRGQRGSAIIEAALVTPVFFMLIFGIMEFGMALRNYLAVSNATTEGARSASVLGRDREADFFVLQSIADGIEAMGLENVDYVVVFEADKINGAVPDACRTSSVDGLCNRYTRSDFFLALEDAVGNSTGNWGCGQQPWTATGARSTTPTTLVGDWPRSPTHPTSSVCTSRQLIPTSRASSVRRCR